MTDTGAPVSGTARFRGWPRFLGILLGLAAPLVVWTDLGLAGGPDLAALAGTGAERALGGWGGALAGRVAESPAKLAMALTVLAAAIYGLLQIAAAALDEAAAVGRSRPGLAGRTLRWLSGRAGFQPMRGYLVAAADWGGDALLAPLRLGVSLFPMVGFVGTVIGLSAAIEGLPGAIGDDAALAPVLDSLHVAFDTTLIGLVGALVSLATVRLAEARIDGLARAL